MFLSRLVLVAELDRQVASYRVRVGICIVVVVESQIYECILNAVTIGNRVIFFSYVAFEGRTGLSILYMRGRMDRPTDRQTDRWQPGQCKFSRKKEINAPTLVVGIFGHAGYYRVAEHLSNCSFINYSSNGYHCLYSRAACTTLIEIPLSVPPTTRMLIRTIPMYILVRTHICSSYSAFYSCFMRIKTEQ